MAVQQVDESPVAVPTGVAEPLGTPAEGSGAVAPRSRRALLTAGIGGLAGVALGALGLPRQANAAAGQALIIGSEANYAGASNTQLIAVSDVVAFRLLQNGLGTALMGHVTPTTGTGRGVYGRTDSAAGSGVQARNAGAAFAGGAAVQAFGQANHGLDVSTDSNSAIGARIAQNGAGTSGGPAVLGSTAGGTTADRQGLFWRGGGEFYGPNGVIGATHFSGGHGVIGVASSGSGGYFYSSNPTGGVSGVYGQSASTAGYGVQGSNPSSSGSTRGVIGQGYSPTGYGVEGVNSGTSGYAVGVRGTSNNSSLSVGAEGSGQYLGVWAHANATSGTNYGVFASTSSPTAGWAIWAAGDVEVTGTLYKAAGSFKIDHPLDPANKYLLHSFVESPDMKNVYDGVVKLDGAGEAKVELPDWFGALNKEFRYQLTAIGGSAPDLYIKDEVKDNAFSIAGGKAGQRVSWQLTGIRQDAWANEHRIPVEMKKTGDEKGRFLHPTENGQAASKGLKQPKPANVQAAEKPAGNSNNQVHE